MFIIYEVLQGLPAEMAGPLKRSSECSLPGLEICFIHLKTQAFSFLVELIMVSVLFHNIIIYGMNIIPTSIAAGPQKAFPVSRPDGRPWALLRLVTLKSYFNVVLQYRLFNFFFSNLWNVSENPTLQLFPTILSSHLPL